ncbi:putative secreted protein like [Verticillium longisporum]|uniref:Putative secreted protein like n=1 Tax=Verticillium longisporum TaxID=100787 RepID=A0A8I3AQV4_VERLO|nr:hypothetical protein VdG1_07433 [Verticillium dahliae VDG1]KAG7132918.1 putative secreted protein like [Verticillium longisporum]RBQ83575.1 hypothetical protein VDGD_04019 [Verticillium dahliae]
MKFNAILLALVPAALALPTTDEAQTPKLAARQSITAVTDSLSFSLTLPQFTTRRNNRDPANLDWSSDGCTTSPDNPFGFPFVPACHRHDFGYHNFRAQTRFTESNKLRIDNQFRTDLRFQCQSSSVRGVCNALADVYYSAVRAFGGDDATPGKRDEHSELVAIYDEKVAIYDKLVAEAQAKGQLWTV